MRHTARIAFIAIAIFATAPHLAYAENNKPDQCEKTLKPQSDSTLAAAEKFEAFFAAIGTQLFERDFFLRISKLALLSKEHVLMLGPPGNAKSMGVDLIIDNIVDEGMGETSVFKIQMTPETSLSETHGVIDYKKITEENIQTRKWEQGLLSAKLVFIDEFFDARANSIRNNLMALNEREHAQGRERIKGITETGFAASNKYLHEVYEKAGDDGPKAIIDRFAFVSYVPGELSELRSAINLIRETAHKSPGRITFKELDLLRAKMGEIEIPEYVAQMLTLVFTRMKAQTESLEESEKKRFAEQKKSGLTPLPPYRSTKYFSPRTLRKAGKVLKAIVLEDWIHSHGKRSLTANSQDLEKLVEFFTLNSLEDDFLTRLEESTVNPYEKIQVMTVLKEREMFRTIYQDMMTEVNSQTSILTDLEIERDTAITDKAKDMLIMKMVETMLGSVMAGTSVKEIHQLDEANLAQGYLRVSLETSLREMLGAKYDEIVAQKVRSIELERERKLQEERNKAREEARRIADEKRRREAEERRMAAEREAAIARMSSLRSDFNDPSKSKVVSINSDTGVNYPVVMMSPLPDQKFEILSLVSRTTTLETFDSKTGNIENRNQHILPFSENPMAAVRLSDGKYLIWYSNFGRIYDPASGINPRKQIYEISNEQYITQNSRHGQIWLFDPSQSKLGIISEKEIADIEWKDLSQFNVEAGGFNLAHFFQDLRNSGRVILSEESGVAHMWTASSSLGNGAFWKVDINRRKITLENSVKVDHPKYKFSAMQGEPGINLGMIPGVALLVDTSSNTDDMYPGTIEKYDLNAGRSREIQVGIKTSTFGHLERRQFALSPDETYLIFAQGNALVGYDLINHVEFPIQVDGFSGNVKSLHFLDPGHILTIFPSGHAVIRLPTAKAE